MFRQIECTLILANKFGLEFPEFSSPILFEVEKRIAVTKVEIYLYETDTTQFYYGYKIQKLIMSELYVAALGPFSSKDFIAGLRLFSKTVGNLFESGKPFLAVMDEEFQEAFFPLITEFNLEHIAFPSYLYYMTKKQEELLLSSPELTLPEGYVLDSARPEDAEFITNTWIHKAPGEKEQTEVKVQVFPSSAIRFNGQLVAFEMVHANGMINHQYVVPEYRGKGLGRIVEEDLTRKMIREKLIVYKTVETYNSSVINSSNKSSLWTMRKKTDGTPNIRIYTVIWPKGMDPFKE